MNIQIIKSGFMTKTIIGSFVLLGTANTYNKAQTMNAFERGKLLAQSLKKQKEYLSLAKEYLAKKMPALAKMHVMSWKFERERYAQMLAVQSGIQIRGV